MTDIIKGNKLIYCFMNPENEKEVLTFADWWWDDKLYHTSWDWLMPVVEKIGEYHYPEYWGKRGKPKDANKWGDTAYLRTFGMRDDEGNYLVRFNSDKLQHAKTLLEATWLAVVDFIQLYNEQKIIDWKTKSGYSGIL